MKLVLDYQNTSLGENSRMPKPSWIQVTLSYILRLFPILRWIRHYNFSWLFQDIIAGVTVGLLAVPQGIAYAKIANLDPQYGLYTSFVGVMIYCVFGTSRDISVGPITVVSLLVGNVVTKVTQAHSDITGAEIAVCLSLVCGVVTLLMGMFRLGILVDFISGPAIAGYMTGSAITIGLGQWPNMFGMTGVDIHQPPYLVFIEFIQQLSSVHMDAAFGLSTLAILYTIKFGTGRLAARIPRFKKPLFFMGIMRNGMMVIIGTLVSFVLHMGSTNSIFKIIKDVPAGFDAIGIPHVRMDIIKESIGALPSIILILVLEHVSVAKSFGRLGDYSIQSNQEIMAIGVSNIIGAFFGAYPATGAFSRTAVMASSGAKTPLAGLFTGGIVVLSLYVLTPAFYFIPEAVLAAVVVHAVSDLVSGPAYILELYRTSALELCVFLLGVGCTCFVGVEIGIYVSVGLSLVIMLLQLARPPVLTLGKLPLKSQHYHSTIPIKNGYSNNQRYIYVDDLDPHFTKIIEPLPPGMLVVRLMGSILYPNADYVAEKLTHLGKTRTRKCDSHTNIQPLPWNESIYTSKNNHLHHHQQQQPILGAIVLDMAAVHSIDTTGLQALGCVRTTLERHAGQTVEWHFTGLQGERIRRDLLTFGFGTLGNHDSMEISAPAAPTKHETHHSLIGSIRSTQHETTTISIPSTQHQQHLHRGSILQKLEHDDEKAIVASWRSTAFMELDVHRFSGRRSLYDPLAMDIDPYYASISMSTDPHDELPTERYPCFHWDLDTAVRTISDRWHQKKMTRLGFGG